MDVRYTLPHCTGRLPRMVCRMGIHRPFFLHYIMLSFGRKVWYNRHEYRRDGHWSTAQRTGGTYVQTQPDPD